MSVINIDLARPAWKQGSALVSYQDLVALEAVLCGIHGRTDGRDKWMSFQPPWSCQLVISPTARRLRLVAMPTGCYLSDAPHWLAKLVRTGELLADDELATAACGHAERASRPTTVGCASRSVKMQIPLRMLPMLGPPAAVKAGVPIQC